MVGIARHRRPIAQPAGLSAPDAARAVGGICAEAAVGVAARGTRHLRVAKQANGGFVTSNIESLDADTRVEEIARMLGGLKITATTRQHAAEMLAG